MSLQKIYGRRAVLEALKADASRIRQIILARGGHGGILQELMRLAETCGISIEWADKRRFDKLAGPVVHQGVIALTQGREYFLLEDILELAKGMLSQALVVALDELEDPRNVGAIARCAEAAGACGMVMTSHRSAEITAVAEKASGGALEHLPVARVVNLSNALADMKTAGLWIAGLDAKAGQELWSIDLNRPLAVVVGNEGKGLRRLTKEKCDFLLRIPMLGKVDSLNASVAAGVVLFEIMRQRRITLRSLL